MSLLPGSQPQGLFPPTGIQSQILFPTLLVDAVRRDLLSLLPQAQFQGQVTVSQTRLQEWENLLQTAVQQLQQIPTPLIFPPPRFSTLISQAVVLINQVIARLGAIPVVTPAIFPPQPGQATISLQTLLQLIAQLEEAERLLIEAIRSV